MDNETQSELIGQIRPKPGHKLFKFKDGDLSVVGDDEYSVITYGNGFTQKRLVVEPGAKYATALNKRNALKRMLRSGLIERVKK